MHRAAAVIALSFCLLAASCATRPVAEVRVSHTLNSTTESQSTGLVLDIDGAAIDRLPAGWASPLASRSTLITGPANELKAASPSAAETIIVERDRDLPMPGYQADFGRVETLKPARVLIPAGSSGIVSIGAAAGHNQSPHASAVDVIIRAGADTPELLLRAVRLATEEEAVLASTGSREVQTLRVPWPLEGREGQFVLYLAASGDLDRPTLWRFRARPMTDLDSVEARDLVASLLPPAPSNARALALARSLRAARSPADSRKALAFAALDAQAPVASESAVLADDNAVLVLAAAAAESLEAPGLDDAGWRLDRSALATIGKLQADNTLDRALAAAISARFGEVGRDIASLARLAATSATRADFDTRVVAEHLILLEDTSPSARVRAFDWLAARSAAPEGYDPLGTAKERRAAMDRYVQSMEARR